MGLNVSLGACVSMMYFTCCYYNPHTMCETLKWLLIHTHLANITGWLLITIYQLHNKWFAYFA